MATSHLVKSKVSTVNNLPGVGVLLACWGQRSSHQSVGVTIRDERDVDGVTHAPLAIDPRSTLASSNSSK